jgi:hypothetical protein
MRPVKEVKDWRLFEVQAWALVTERLEFLSKVRHDNV